MSAPAPRAPAAVIVPARNAASTLDAALSSVAGQTLGASEVIVIDDGSDDNTASVAARWRSVLPLEVVSLGANRGPGAARNEGVQRTSAPILAFFDADDVWLPNHLEVCVDLHQRFSAAVAGRCVRWYPARGFAAEYGLPSTGDAPTQRTLDSIVRHGALGMHAVLARDVFDEVGGFDLARDGVEDWDLWIRIARTGTPVYQPANATLLKRQHAHNLSNDSELLGRAGLRLLDDLEHGVLSAVERRALSGALREPRARLTLGLARARLDAGDWRGARALALHALRAPTDVAVRACVMVFAPRWWSRRRVRRRSPLGDPPTRNTGKI